MRAALEPGGAEASRPAVTGSRSLRIGSLAPGGLVLGLAVLVAAAIFAGGGSGDGSIFPIGVGAIAVAAAALGAGLAGVLPLPRLGRAGGICLALSASLVLVQLLSVAWSIAPDRSWAYANRGLVYLAFLVLGAVAGALRRNAPSLLAAGLAVLVAAANAWALAGKIAPGLAEDGGRIARLRVPVGYWNGLALLLVLGLPLALWLATDPRRTRLVRAGAMALLVALVVGLVLTYSRGGILAAAGALAVWLVLDRRRLESVGALFLAAPFAGGILVFALGRSGLVDDGQPFDVRADDGRAFGLALGLGLVAAFGAAIGALRLAARFRLGEARRAGIGRTASRLALLLLLAAGIALAVRGPATAGWIERQADEFANPPTELLTQESTRLTSFSSNNRWSWWQEGWEAFTGAPVAGIGASAFPTAHRILREDALTVTTPHSLPLQLLAETGVIGAFLGCGAGVAALLAIRCSLRRLEGRERAAAAALAAGIAAFALHTLVDFDWDFLALAVPVLVSGGLLFAAGRAAAAPSARRPAPFLAVPLVAFGVAFVSLGAPWLAERRVDAAYAALGAGRGETALDRARTARSLDPLSLDPLYAEASARIALGDLDGARAVLVRAVDLQPLDADAWYELGAFELELGGRPEEARRYLARSAQLDPRGAAPALLAQAQAAGGS